MASRPSRVPAILFWTGFLLALLAIGPIGYAIVSLDSRPGGSGADWPAKLLIALLVAALAALAGLAFRAIAALIISLVRRPPA